MSGGGFELPRLDEGGSWAASLSRRVGSIFAAGLLMLALFVVLVLGRVPVEVAVEGQGVFARQAPGQAAGPAEGQAGGQAKRGWTARLEVAGSEADSVRIGQEVAVQPVEPAAGGGARRPAGVGGRVLSVSRSSTPPGSAAPEPGSLRVTVEVEVVPWEGFHLEAGAPVTGRIVVGREPAGKRLLRGLRRSLPGGEG